MSLYFTKMFVHLSVNAALPYFSFYKLKVWDPANIYLFKFNNRNTKKRCEIYPKLTLKKVEKRSYVSFDNFKIFDIFSNVSIIQPRFKSWLFGLHVFFTFFRN